MDTSAPTGGSVPNKPSRDERDSRGEAIHTRALQIGTPYHMHRSRPASPLVARKKPTPSRPRPPLHTQGEGNAGHPNRGPSLEALRLEHGGWSQPPPQGVQTFPVFTTKKALRQGYRYHVIRFVRARALEEDKFIDPSDQEEFTRPVTLHRRDPRQPSHGRSVKPDIQPEPALPVDDGEAEKLAQAKAQREAQRALDQAKIAPVTKDATPTLGSVSKKSKRQKEEKTTINRAPKTDEGKKESDLRYEEALPWHLEDADGKNIWVGNYVSALSEANTAIANVAFVIDRPGFRMIPLEKWYKFTAKPPFTPYSLDEAEALMNQKTDIGRWAMRDQERKDAKKEWAETRSFLRGPAPIKNKSRVFPNASRSEGTERDEIDISGDEFQDDDEAPTMEVVENDDERDVKARVRRDQLGANLFGEGDEQEVDREEQEEIRERQNLKKLGKKLKKALVRREHDIRYQSDSSGDDPFDSSSDDTSSADEATKDDKSLDGAARLDSNTMEKDESTLRISTIGPTKPKHSELGKKTKTLKRAGSPTLSESSGNESSRKKAKSGSVSHSRSVTPLSSGARALGVGSFGIDTEGVSNDTVDAPPAKRMRLGADGGDILSPSRVGSPMPAIQHGQVAVGTGPIEAQEIMAQLPPLPGGTSIATLMKSFQSRVGEKPGQTSRKDWIKLVKANTVYGPDKLLRRKA